MDHVIRKVNNPDFSFPGYFVCMFFERFKIGKSSNIYLPSGVVF